MGARSIFFRGVGKLGGLGLPSPAGSRNGAPMGVWVWTLEEKSSEADECFETSIETVTLAAG